MMPGGNGQWHDWISRARAVPIGDVIGRRRGLNLKCVGRVGKKYFIGPCPRCGGEDRLSASIAKNVFNCRGCEAKGDVIDFVQHVDRVDFRTACETLAGPPPPKANGKGNSQGGAAERAKKVVVATFKYHDQSGTVLFAVDRIELQNPDGAFVLKDGKCKKSFLQKRPDPDHPERWINNIDGVPVVPYRLPELMEAVANGQTVLIVEGEGKVDLLRRWNVPATCCAGGALSWTAEHAKFLRDGDVVILPDNDDRGHQYTDLIGRSLQGIARSVRVLELPDLPPKGDIIDWAKAGGTRERLDALLQAAPDWELPPVSDTPSESDAKRGGEKSPPSLVIRRAADIEPEKIDWLWPGRIARGKHTCIAGEPGTGKSQLSIAIIAAITTGSEWPCREGKASVGNAILLSAEDGAADTIRPRLEATGADLKRVHLISAVHDVDRRRTLNLQHDLDLLESKIAEIGDVALVVIDPISSYLGKTDSHKNSEVRSLLEPLSEMAERTRVAILSVTHFSKTGANTTTKALHRFIGSIAFTGAPRAAFAVIDDAEHDGRRLFLHAKNNLAPIPQGLAFCVEQCLVGDSIVASRIVWDAGPVAITANEALAADAAGSEVHSAIEEAVDWLHQLLAGGATPASLVRAEAEAAGLSWATIKRAKKAAGVEHFREGGVADKGRWLWRLSTSETLTGSSNAYLAQEINVSQLGKIEPVSSNGADAPTVGNGPATLPEQAPGTADVTMRAPEATMRAHHKNRAHMENEGAHEGNGHADDDLTIPPYLDRRHEVCDQCRQPGGTEWDYLGTKVRLHGRCERAWIRAYEASRNGPTDRMGARS